MENKKIELIACYIRVSSNEQVLHGLSLDAQRDILRTYAETHNLKIVEWYEDEGISGRKMIKNRPALQRMIKDAQLGKFERIIFIKLDRFFRSVAEYHECMKLIDPVIWTATEEKYDLSTANGRAFVNMKITIAELEADQTGERIDIVNEYKVKTGQALTGSQCQGFGYIVKKDKDGIKRVVKDPVTAPMLEDYINHFMTYHNKRQAYIYVRDKYNIDVTYAVLSRMIKDPKLCGSYRGNDNYIAEPYVDMATFIKIQELLKRNIRTTSTNRIFMFSGLIRCPDCGSMLVGKHTGGNFKTKKPSGKVYEYYRDIYNYRCNGYYQNAKCTFSRQPNEKKMEKALLDSLESYVDAHITEVTVNDNRADVDNDAINKKIKDIKTEMKNTTTAFRKNRMTEAEYDKEYEKLEVELKELEARLVPVEERDLTIYEELLKSDWRELYDALNKENKRAFWRKYLKAIELNLDGTIKQPIFF